MDKEEYMETMRKVEEAEKEVQDKEEVVNPVDEVESLPDLTEFVQSEEYLRNGKNSHIPLKVELNGHFVRVYIRPLTSQEFYTLQRKSMNQKESVDLLACQLVCTDSNGKSIPSVVLEKLPAGVIETISVAIRVASGLHTEEVDVTEVMRDFLKD